MQFVIKRIFCLLFLLATGSFLKIVVTIHLKNTGKNRGCDVKYVSQTHLQKAAMHKHSEVQKAVFKTELFCSGRSHFFLNMGD